VTLARRRDPDAFVAAAAPVVARNAAVRALVQSWVDGWRAGRMAPSYAATYRAGDAAGFALQREGPLSIVRERLAAGVRRVFLVTDLDKPPSNALYARIGFEPSRDTVRYDLLAAPA